MAAPEYNNSFWLKRFLPSSLFGRAILILVLPMLILQASVLYFFYVQHWQSIERHLSSSLAGDIGFLVHEMQTQDPAHQLEIEDLASDLMHIDLRLEKNDPKLAHFPSRTDDAVFAPFVDRLRETISEPFLVREPAGGGGRAILYVKLPNNVLRLQFSLKRLASITTDLFIWWILGSTILLLFIATVFLRNQIRPIRKLAEAAERFGRGQESIDFRPQGATEVRQAGRSFLAMRERLKRMISARTEMLAAISHDLRTPLTRMRLALAMLPEQKYARPLLVDVQDMEKMIQEYLDFARGKGGEAPKNVHLRAFLEEVVGRYREQGREVGLSFASDPEIVIFRNAMRRCLYNVIDNALKYGTSCEVRGEEMARRVEILIDDDGPGIPPESREQALQPFRRLDAARNPDGGGAGLGLSIVQDIVLRHGGELSLEDSPLGGLRVRIRLPL